MDFISSFLRFVALVKYQSLISSWLLVRFVVYSFCRRRRNGFHFFVSSFCRVGQSTTKRQSYREISKFDFSWLLVRFVVYSFCRLPQGTKTTERQRDKMRFCGHFVLSFVRFVALYKSPKRRNEISFWRLFVLSPSIRRQNEQTKWPYPASIVLSFVLLQMHRDIKTPESMFIKTTFKIVEYISYNIDSRALIYGEIYVISLAVPCHYLDL